MVDNTLTELCQELKNWFDRNRYYGTFTLGAVGHDAVVGVAVVGLAIAGSRRITSEEFQAEILQNKQYYRIIGSTFNDGIHRYDADDLEPETFTGSIWALAIPKVVIKLSEDIDAWRAKYEAPDSSAMSPYMSESFGGYSYSKGSAISGTGTGGATSWRTSFASRMNAWRKLQ